MSVTGRPLAVVTGAGRGLGAHFTEDLVREGYDVVRWDLVFHDDNSKAERMIVDVTDEAAVCSAVTQLDRPISVLVNNAGINEPVPTFDLELSVWVRIIQVNLTGALICAREVARTMRGRGGAVVNVASIAGLVGLSAHSSAAYAASKGGLISMTRALAVEWASERIAVNAVAPGMVETDLTRGRLNSPAYREAILARTPARAFVAASDVSEAVVYLARQSSAAVSGHVVVVDGGWTAS